MKKNKCYPQDSISERIYILLTRVYVFSFFLSLMCTRIQFKFQFLFISGLPRKIGRKVVYHFFICSILDDIIGLLLQTQFQIFKNFLDLTE